MVDLRARSPYTEGKGACSTDCGLNHHVVGFKAKGLDLRGVKLNLQAYQCQHASLHKLLWQRNRLTLKPCGEEVIWMFSHL